MKSVPGAAATGLRPRNHDGATVATRSLPLGVEKKKPESRSAVQARIIGPYILLDPEFQHPRAQGAGVESQDQGRAVGAPDSPPRTVQPSGCRTQLSKVVSRAQSFYSLPTWWVYDRFYGLSPPIGLRSEVESLTPSDSLAVLPATRPTRALTRKVSLVRRATTDVI
jgi:hypothetical protein